MRRLWVAAAFAPLAFAAQARADTTITSATTTPVSTSTGGNISINNGGSLKPSAGPAAVTVDANGNVTNAGSISYDAVGNSSGVLVDGNATSTITNSGAITDSETVSGDTTNQSITTGPFANGANRFGIEVAGPYTLTGTIDNTGSITIIGENSAGISIGSGGITGDLISTGTITVTGGDYASTAGGTNLDVTYGINAAGRVGGNVAIGGTISATGQNATGVVLAGGAGGSITLQGTITATGYRSTTAPTDPTVIAKLNADQTLQGGPALVIGGNVGAGVNITAAVAASGNVSAVPEGSLTVYGSAPALLIGGNAAMTIGKGSTYDVLVGGAITANGDYPNVSATGVQIGGSNPLAVSLEGVASGAGFGSVTLADGLDVTGSVAVGAETHDVGKGDAIGILVGANGAVGALVNSGTITATVETDAKVTAGGPQNEIAATGAEVPVTAAAIEIAPGASVASFVNSGNITAVIAGIPTALNYTAAGGVEGQAIAVEDTSGSVSSVKNTGNITAVVSPIVLTQSPSATNSAAVALYLANLGNPVTVTQSAPSGNTTVTPNIVGDVILGRSDGSSTGAETLNLLSGNLTGSVAFNGVGSNSLTIDNGAILEGGLSQAASGELAINVNNGQLLVTSPLANTLGGAAASLPVSTLAVGSKGTVVLAINPTTWNPATPLLKVAGNATLATGGSVGAIFLSKLPGTETFTLIHAGNLTVGGLDTAFLGSLSFLYEGTLTNTANDLDLTVALKTGSQLGFNASEDAAFTSVYNAIGTDLAVEEDLLSKTTRSSFLHFYDQLLPDYEGGTFNAITNVQRSFAAAETDAPVRMETDQVRGWAQEIGVDGRQDGTGTANGYKNNAIGLAGGVERATGQSALGLAAAVFTTGSVNGAQTTDSSVSSVTLEAGVYYRTGGPGLNIDASINGGWVALGEHRYLLDETAAGAVTLRREAKATWMGALASGHFGVSYQITQGRFYLRPSVAADYVMLLESPHDEHGGGPALDAWVQQRLSQMASVEGDLVMGYTFGDAIKWRPELTVGWRQTIWGGPGKTTTHYLVTGQDFSLTPSAIDTGGLLARLGIRASGSFTDVSASAGGEIRNGYQSYDARAIARFLF